MTQQLETIHQRPYAAASAPGCPALPAAARASGNSAVEVITTSFWVGMITALVVAVGRGVAGYLDSRAADRVERQGLTPVH